MDNVQKGLDFATDMLSDEKYDGILIPFIVGLDLEHTFILPEEDSSSLRKLIEKGRGIIRKKSKKEGDCVLIYEGLLTFKNNDSVISENKAIVCEIVDTEIRYYQRFYYDKDGFHEKGSLIKIYDENKTTGYEQY